MSASGLVNSRVVLNSRPIGAPTLENFRFENAAIPEIADGQVLLKTEFLSLDPYMRGRMNDAPSYAPPVAINAVMGGESVSRVVSSGHADFVPGDRVLGFGGWQTYWLSEPNRLRKLDPELSHASLALGVLGMPGFTAYTGLLTIGQPKPGETVVVAAASGAVGSVVGQIAKLKGCKVVGIAGGKEKCGYVVKGLDFDVCIDHRAPEFAGLLSQACPNGIDVYFENVGGAVFDAVMPLLNVAARVPVCGLIANYNDTGPSQGPDRLGRLMRLVLTRRLKVQGFIIYDDYAGFDDFSHQMRAWLSAGAIKFREDVVEGLESAPRAFVGLLQGDNFGKLVVRVS